MKIEIEIGDNLKDFLISQNYDTKEELEIIMKSLERMFENQKVYTCQLCGGAHYVGDICPYQQTEKLNMRA